MFNGRIGITEWYRVDEFKSRLEFDGLPSQTVCYQAGNRLPTAYESHASAVPGKKDLRAELNRCVTCEDTGNLTPANKVLLQWHYHLGHKHLTSAIQRSMRQLPDIVTAQSLRPRTSELRCPAML